MIQFRPHHFLCTVGFQGKGYSPAFIRNYKKIAVKITENPDTPIKVCSKLDSICGPCPNQTPDKQCNKQSLIDKLDAAHQEILGLKEDQIITWRESLALIKEKMTLDNFHRACEGCSWKSYGICEAALKGVGSLLSTFNKCKK